MYRRVRAGKFHFVSKKCPFASGDDAKAFSWHDVPEDMVVGDRMKMSTGTKATPLVGGLGRA